ncbi:DUF4328 domain-containing protein [Pseudonocardiaceae bacterium YIM PH 21723]|nr:DUF4328 domain-containing protein [Pseudonocardiaceae bacterium YIM PH 21723]
MPVFRPLTRHVRILATLMVVGPLLLASPALLFESGITGRLGLLASAGSIVGALLLLAGMMRWIDWLTDARTNAELMSDRPHRVGRGLMVVSWFIPIVNLVLPYLVLRDLWRASLPESPARRFTLVELWWLVEVTMFVAVVVLKAPFVPQLNIWLLLAAAAFVHVAALIPVVVRISRAQEAWQAAR